ncbi:MAG: amidohydrolase [Egibacteraceae bacterium]
MRRSLLLVAAGVHTLAEPLESAQPAAVRALVVDGDRIAWVGAVSESPPTEQVVDLGGAWVTPAFVDAHVHATATGLALTGVDLAGAASAAQCLDRLMSHAVARPSPVLIGTGWDDFGWPEQRPPRAAQLAHAAPGRTVLLVRVDGHSCLVDPGTLARLPLLELKGVDRDADGTPTGLLRESASEAAQTLVRGLLPPAQLAAARRAVCERAAALGIGSLHEMGHPGLSGLDDAITWATGRWPVEVVTWWAELDPDRWRACLSPDDYELRPGGDLFLDGSIGTGTAAMTSPYRCGDRLTCGELFHPDQAVIEFFVTCTRAGRGAGVHAIGDRAIEQALRALEATTRLAGLDAVRACRHRIEHVELPSADQIRRMGRLGVVASVQPAFDAAWGGSDGLYAARFGPDAARDSNPFVWFARAGVRLAFGSDSTVTPLDPWGAVVAAERHRGGWGLDRRAALIAHTLGGRYVAGQDHVGPLRPGARADLAVWSSDPLAVDDPRSLRCLATVTCGEVVHGDLGSP